MRRILFILTLLSVGVFAYGQTGTGWSLERRKVNFRDSTYFTKDANFYGPFRINGTAVTSNAAELNILDGALTTYTEINYLVGVTSAIQTQLNAKQATLVSGTNIKTVNGETVLGAGNIVISGEGGAMVYPGAGIPISTGTAWGTSLADQSAEWDSAYTGRYRWSGTPIGLTAATGRTSLGGTTVGQNMFTLTNPDAIRFLRVNADNTVTALTAALFKTALSLTASDVSLGNVTNESKTTMFTSPTFTTTVTLPATTYVPSAGALSFDSGDITLTHSANTLTLGGGNLALGANSLTTTGSIGSTGSRVLKGWFTDLEVTNAIAGSITGTAATVTGFTRNSGTLTLSGGHGITLTTTGTTALTLPTSGTLATNPMSAVGDLIIGGTAGAPTRLTAGTNGYILTMASGSPAWAVATGGAALEARIDSIVTILADTMNIESLLLIDLDTDTVADLSEVRLRVLRADSTDVFATPTQIADTMTARIAAATVGVAAADSNVYAGYTTRTYVESLLGSGSGLSAQRLPFIIGVTTGAPSAADTTVVHSEFEGKHIDLYRDGAKQYQQFTATNIYEGFRVNGSTITVNPAWQANEQVMVDIIEPILWSYLSLEGQESTLLTGLSGYWKLDESAGTTAVDATGGHDGSTTATVNAVGKLGRAYEFDAAVDVVSIPYNTSVSPKGAAFSVSVWFKLDSLPTVTGRSNYLFQQNNTDSPYLAHSIEVRNDDNRIFVRSLNTAGTQYTVLSSGTLSVDTWYNVVFVNRGNGQTLQVYLNGTDVSSSAGTFTGTAFEGLYDTCFGNAYSTAVSYLDGTLDSFGIWSKALSSGEVTELYNSGNGKTYPFN